MFNTIELKPNDPVVQKLTQVSFPSYNGRSFKVQIHDKPGMSLTSYWNSGSRDYFKVVRLEDYTSVSVPENGSGFTANNYTQEELPSPGFCVVEHSISLGKDMGLTFHLHTENATALLPSPSEISWEESVVLLATRSRKSSYAGISNYRQHSAITETGITKQEYETAKASLIAKKLLNASGAITVDGKNACPKVWDLSSLKRK